MRNPGKFTPRRLGLLAILLALVFLLAFNFASARLLVGLQVDLTEDQRYTLNPVTEQLLSDLQEPIVVRFYVSSELLARDSTFAQHAQRVGEMLETFAALSGGKLSLQRFDPKPYSPEEDLAVADGLQGYSLSGQGGDQIYFGLAATNSTDDRKNIPFFPLDRANYLEYDLAQIVLSLAQPEKPKLAYIGALGLLGDQENGFQPQVAMQLMQQYYDVTFVNASTGGIPDDIAVAILAQPASLDEASAYAIDQFVMRGGRLLVFVDPFSEQAAAAAMAQYQPASASDLTAFRPLLAAWGAELQDNVIAADRLAARRVMANSGGQQVVTDYVAWLGLPAQAFASDDPLMGQMQLLNLNSAGILKPSADSGANFKALAATSSEGMALSIDDIAFMPNPIELLAHYQPGGERLPVIARLKGPMKSLYPAPPEALKARGEADYADLVAKHLNQVDAGEVLVVADSDFLFDAAWLSTGGGSVTPVANNGEFLLNALDELSGIAGLSALRGKSLIDRPFEVILQIQRDAELKYRTREQQLTDQISQAESEIGQLEEDASGGVVLSEEQAATLEKLRVDLLQARRELRQVQLGLRQDLDAIVTKVQLVNIAGVPILVALMGFAVAFVHRWRARRSMAAGSRGRR